MIAEVIFESDTKLGGCAIGDVYPDRPGLEICVVTGAGELHVLSRAAGFWVAETPLSSPGELIQVAVGELLPERPGDEILAGGMLSGTEDEPGPGKLWVCGRTRKGKWYAEPVLEPQALVHAVLIADLDPAFPGNESYSGGFDDLVQRLEFLRTFPGEVATVGKIGDAAKGMCAYRGGLAVTLANGSLVYFDGGDTQANALELFRSSSGLARIASRGDQLIVSSNDGRFWLVEWNGKSDAEERVIFTEAGGAKGRGAAWADLGGKTGPIPVTAGYSGNVTALRPLPDGSFEPHVLHAEGQALHHLSAGDVLPEFPGDELVTVGYSGRVVLLHAQQ